MVKQASARICGPIQIEHLDQEGRGVGRSDGKVAFVENALPGERVTFKVLQDKARFFEGVIERILVESNERTIANCTHFGTCGGCRLQHLQADAQVRHKEQMLLQQLKHLGRSTPTRLLPALTANHWGYRGKARLGVQFVRKIDGLLVGFRERSGKTIAPIRDCPVLLPGIGEKVGKLTDCLNGLKARQHMTQIEIAAGDDEIALAFRLRAPLEMNDQDILLRFGRENGLRIFLQPGGPASAYPIDGGEPTLAYSLPEFDLHLHFNPTDFTQINAFINRQMVAQAVDLLAPEPNDRVLDLFCGVGNFSLALTRCGATVTGVEGSETMVKRAHENALHNNLPNIQFIAEDLAKKTQRKAWSSQRYDKILLDPPRQGALEMLEMIMKSSAQRVVYVSCNPSTLARDTAVLLGKRGFKLAAAGVMDMFPHTAHIESMALFER